MSRESENVARLKQAYADWAGGKGTEKACWECLLADQVTLRSLAAGAPEMPFSAPRNSRQEVIAYLDDLTRDWEMLSFEMTDYVAQGDRVVAIGHAAWRNRATGKTVETPKVDLWRFEDGRAVEVAEFYDTAGAIAAATP